MGVEKTGRERGNINGSFWVWDQYKLRRIRYRRKSVDLPYSLVVCVNEM